jgi:hypothetical protein
MCQDSEKYREFPAVTIGGLTGDYFATCPIASCEWADYCIDSVVNGDGGTSAAVLSGNSKPVALDYTGISTSKLNDYNILHAVPLRVPATVTQIINGAWERLTNSQKRVFLRVDAAASTSLYVTIRFRVRLLKVVPGPFVEVHPENAHALNVSRAEATRARLGLDKEIEKGEGLNARR